MGFMEFSTLKFSSPHFDLLDEIDWNISSSVILQIRFLE